MTLLNTQSVSVLGTELTMTNASASDTCAPGAVVVVDNGSASSTTVTVVVPGNTKYGVAAPDYTKTITAGNVGLIGPLPTDLADPITGLITIQTSPTTTIRLAAVAVINP